MPPPPLNPTNLRLHSSGGRQYGIQHVNGARRLGAGLLISRVGWVAILLYVTTVPRLRLLRTLLATESDRIVSGRGRGHGDGDFGAHAVDKTAFGVVPDRDGTRRPRFVLHVGPLKTGSTSLQCAFSTLRTELGADGYVFMGTTHDLDKCPPQDDDDEDDDNDDTRQSSSRGDSAVHERTFYGALSLAAKGCHGQLKEMEIGTKQHRRQQPDVYPPCWSKFLTLLDAYRRNGTSIIYSEENISTMAVGSGFPYRHLLIALQDWDVHVVVVHRHLFDWLPSAHNEEYKPGPGKVRLGRWFRMQSTGNNGIGGGVASAFGGKKGKLGKCVDQGGRAVPTVYDLISRNVHHPTRKKWPDAMQVAMAMRREGMNAILVPMEEDDDDEEEDRDRGGDGDANGGHENGELEPRGGNRNEGMGGKARDLVTRVVCNHVPGASGTCRKLLMIRRRREENKKKEMVAAARKRSNPSVSLHYDALAVGACHAGLINGTAISRGEARDAIRDHHEITNGGRPNDLPLSCPTEDELRPVLEASMDDEREAFKFWGQTWGVTEEGRHREKFRRAMLEGKKFCSVDSARALEEESWISFFAVMRK